MEEKVIIKGNSNKVNILTVLFGLATAVFLVLAIDMALAGDSNTGMWVGIAILLTIITVIIVGTMSFCEIVVTDKRIYGKVAFGKQVDLPMDSVSAVAVTSALTQGVSVSTSSGRITFFYLSNRNEISNKIRELLINRQSDTNKPIIKQETPQSNADELKKYKDLLDSGVITQDEFEAKKKDLLGL